MVSAHIETLSKKWTNSIGILNIVKMIIMLHTHNDNKDLKKIKEPNWNHRIKKHNIKIKNS